MQFEGVPHSEADSEDGSEGDAESESDVLATADDSDDTDDETLIYTVTDVADNQVVLDGNHPLAGMALRFWVQVEDVRAASEEEIENRHPVGGENFTFGMPNDDVEEEDFLEKTLGLQSQAPRILH
jgi:FKBP-type peptidyl-prolyl cis-trans isomerase SlyD